MEGFGKDINRLEISMMIARSEKTRLEGILDKVTINLNVLRAFMEYRISHNMDGSLTITMEKNGSRNRIAEVPKKLTGPLEFAQGDNHGAILNFNRRAGNSQLFLGLPRDRRTSQRDKITCDNDE